MTTTTDLQVFGVNLAAAVTNEGGRASFNPDNNELQAIHLATGNAIAWRPPAGSEPVHAEVTTAARAIRAVSAASHRAKAIETDAMRSDLAKQRDSATAWLDADRALSAVEAEAARDAEQFDKTMHEVFAPPSLDAGDVVGATNDREVRDWVRSLSVEELGKLVTEMQAGKHSRTLAALMRSPIPLPAGMLAQALPELWAEQVRKANPRAAIIESRKGRQEWVQMVLRQTRDALPRARGASVARTA